VEASGNDALHVSTRANNVANRGFGTSISMFEKAPFLTQ
jgi:hypothetical protein